MVNLKNVTGKAGALVAIGVVFVILVLLNFVSVRMFGRLDVTRNHLFTLADASKQLVGKLDDRVTVKAYFTDDLPAPYNNHRRLLLDQLNEYKAYAKGNLQFEFIDPSGEKAEQEAQQQGIAPLQIQVVKEDKFEVKRAYMGLVLQYEDKREVIPAIQNPATLEYEISSTIKRLTSKGMRKIGFLTGHGEAPLSELGRIQEAMRRQYELVPVDVSKGQAIQPDIAALVVMAPTGRIPDPHLFQIDQYVMGGGRVLFLLNKVDINLQNRFGRAIDCGLDGLLDTYGLRINPDLVRDVQCASISIMQQQMGFNIQSQVPFPYLPLASGFSKGNPIVKDLQGVVLFFASSVDTVGLAAKGLTGEVLIRSSKQSGRQSGMFTYDPLQHYTVEDFPEGAIPLAALVQGRFNSAFAGKPIPADTAAGSVPPPMTPLKASTETRLLVVGDGDFARDQYMGNRDNLTFFANMIDYMVDDAGLITIRSKEVSQLPLEQVSDGSKKAIKIANMVLPPLLVVGYGLFRWRMRKARRKALEMQ
jgi:gliding-associated putative ABC transporter substrate-binding component GldG